MGWPRLSSSANFPFFAFFSNAPPIASAGRFVKALVTIFHHPDRQVSHARPRHQERPWPEAIINLAKKTLFRHFWRAMNRIMGHNAVQGGIRSRTRRAAFILPVYGLACAKPGGWQEEMSAQLQRGLSLERQDRQEQQRPQDHQRRFPHHRPGISWAGT